MKNETTIRLHLLGVAWDAWPTERGVPPLLRQSASAIGLPHLRTRPFTVHAERYLELALAAARLLFLLYTQPALLN